MKSKVVALILSIFLGELGIDRFYLGEIEQTDFTDEDEALQLVDSMSKIADGLAAVAGVDAE